MKCEEHKVLTLQVPWADGWARFTARFECVAIDWLKEASTTAVARNLSLSWDQINGIQERAVARGEEQLKGIEAVAMDMHQPYTYSAASFVADILSRLCFDRFHVAQMFAKAVDQQRRSETKRLMKEGNDSLKGTRYLWLKRVAGLPRKLRKQLAVLLETATSVGDVWAIMEAASKLWHYKSRTWAQKAWIALCKAARKLAIPALDKVIDTILWHLFGIVNAILLKASNAASESVNSRNQALDPSYS